MAIQTWWEPAPDHDMYDALLRYSNWLSENLGVRTRVHIGYIEKPISHIERSSLQIIYTELASLDWKFATHKTKHIHYHFGEKWKLFTFVHYSNITSYLAHNVQFVLQTESDLEQVQFKLSCR
jgi:hypothetical protein